MQAQRVAVTIFEFMKNKGRKNGESTQVVRRHFQQIHHMLSSFIGIRVKPTHCPERNSLIYASTLSKWVTEGQPPFKVL
jgi:hypothetical protein